jgi:shikimate kinase
MKIFLIGLPGSGKSTLGKALAEALKLRFIDLDQMIEKEAGKTIPAIFKDEGENRFRNLESDLLELWAAAEIDFVMATGGGAPCFFSNMEVINRSGKSIFLDVPAKEIVKRIKTMKSPERPLFSNVHPEELKDTIEFMRSQRLPFYKKAHHILHLKDLTIPAIVKIING